MSRSMAFALCLVLPTAAHATSFEDFELSKILKKVARESSIGTPRVINEDILDKGHAAEGNQLINHLSMRASHAEHMRSNPDSMRSQLGDSVCSSTGYRRLSACGAILTYNFAECKTNQPVAIERFDAGNCRIQDRKQARRAVVMLDKQHLLKVAGVPMPFGKHQGRMLVDLPEEYLLWFYKKGFLSGELGRLMQLALELEIDGLDGPLKPLRSPAPQTNDVADVIR